MKTFGFAKALDVVASVAVIVAASFLIYSIYQSKLNLKNAPVRENSIGSLESKPLIVSGLLLDQERSHLVVAFSDTCQFCKASVPAIKDLLTAWRAKSRRNMALETHFILISRESVPAENFAKKAGLTFDKYHDGKGIALAAKYVPIVALTDGQSIVKRARIGLFKDEHLAELTKVF